jgi:hypothetical protein
MKNVDRNETLRGKNLKMESSERNACRVSTRLIRFSLNVEYSFTRKKEAETSSETSVLFNYFEGILYLLGFTIIELSLKWTCFVLSNDVGEDH